MAFIGRRGKRRGRQGGGGAPVAAAIKARWILGGEAVSERRRGAAWVCHCAFKHAQWRGEGRARDTGVVAGGVRPWEGGRLEVGERADGWGSSVSG
jgi:hypothetical protein